MNLTTRLVGFIGDVFSLPIVAASNLLSYSASMGSRMLDTYCVNCMLPKISKPTCRISNSPKVIPWPYSTELPKSAEL